MFKTFLYTVITIAAIAWIGYLSLDLVVSKNKNQPIQLFGPQDGRILVVNHLDEVRLPTIEFSFSEQLLTCLNTIQSTSNKPFRYYFSENQSHFAIEANEPWEKSAVVSLLNRLGGIHNSTGVRSFLWKNFEVKFSKNVLDFRKKNTLITKHQVAWDVFDKNSSYALISFKDQNPIIKEYYISDKGTSIYVRNTVDSKVSKSVNDRVLFANYLPMQIDAYHFQSIPYAIVRDPLLKKSKSKNWMTTGLVRFKKRGQNVLMFDIALSLNFSDFLMDGRLIEEPTETTFQFGALFPEQNKAGSYTYSYKQIENIVYISTSSDILTEVDSDIKLGKTLSVNKKEIAQLFDNQAKEVMNRIFTKELQRTVSVYNGYEISKEFIAFQVSTNQGADKENIAERKSFDAMAEVLDFSVGKSQAIVAVNQLNDVYFFKGELKKLVHHSESPFVGTIQMIKDGPLADHHIVTFQNEFVVVKPDGSLYRNQSYSLPINALTSVAYISVLGNEFFLYGHIKNGYQSISKEGRKLQVFFSNEELKSAPEVWSSNRRLFVGVQHENQLEMVDYQKNKVFRVLSLGATTHTSRKSNEAWFFTLLSGQLQVMNQKGILLNTYGQSSKVLISNNKKQAISKQGSQYKIIDLNNGEIITAVTNSETTDLSAFDYLKTPQVQFSALLDGITNKISFYKQGKLQSETAMIGQKKLILSQDESQKSYLYTLNDTYIVRYELPL